MGFLRWNQTYSVDTGKTALPPLVCLLSAVVRLPGTATLLYMFYEESTGKLHDRPLLFMVPLNVAPCYNP